MTSPFARCLALLGAVLMLGGCASSEPLVGRTLEDVRAAIDERMLVIYDLSAPVLGIEGSYSELDPQWSWSVITACGETTMTARDPLPIGVIPADEYAALAERAETGVFDELLVECDTD